MDRWLLLLGIPVLLVLIGLLLPWLARWLLSLEVGLPFRPVFRFVGAVDQPWEIGVNVVIWVIAGLAIGFTALSESVTFVVTNDQLRFTKDDLTSAVARADVATVYPDGKELVVLDGESRQLVRETAAAPMAVVSTAFKRHGFPWQDSDPHADLLTLWTLGTGALPDAVNAVLSARQVALKSKSAAEIGALRNAVEKLGYGLRDEGTKQYWRPLVRS